MNDDWQECRATIGRMDTVLEDLRKYGFSLVIGLLTASGLLGGAANNQPVLPLASLIIMVLVVALFGVDLYYQVLLSGTVERALDLESASATPHLRITKIVTCFMTTRRGRRCCGRRPSSCRTHAGRRHHISAHTAVA